VNSFGIGTSVCILFAARNKTQSGGKEDDLAIDPALTALFRAQPRQFMKNNLLAVRGFGINEQLLDANLKATKRPTFPAMPDSLAPDASDRSEKNYAISQPVIMAGGIERNTQFNPLTNGKTSLQLNSLVIKPLAQGQPPQDMFSMYFLPYADNMSYTMQLDSSPNSPRFFCTEAINGCTFQVAGTMDKPVVTHANVQGMDLTQDVKAQFLEFFLEPARVGATRRANSVIAARLQRFSPSSRAVVDPASVVQYGDAATQSFDAAVLRAIGRSGGVETFTRTVNGVRTTFEANTILTEMNGRPLDPTGGEVAVIGFNPSGRRWLFIWSMYLPVKITTLYYRVGGSPGGGGRTLVDTVVLYDFLPLVSGRFLWPDWQAGTPYSIRNGHLGV